MQTDIIIAHSVAPSLNSVQMARHDNSIIILRTLSHLPTVKYEILGLAAKYGLNGVQGSLSATKDCVWTCFVQKVRFLPRCMECIAVLR